MGVSMILNSVLFVDLCFVLARLASLVCPCLVLASLVCLILACLLCQCFVLAPLL